MNAHMHCQNAKTIVVMSNFEKVKRFSPSYKGYIELPISENFKEEMESLTKERKKQRRLTNQKISKDESAKSISLDYRNLTEH